MTAEIIPENIQFGRIAAVMHVTDIPKALAFYVGVLGMTKVFENGEPVGFVIVRKGDGVLFLSLDRQRGKARDACHLMVNDATAFYDFCNRQGVRVIKGLRDHDYGQRAFVIADPDGNRIDIGQVLG